MILRNRDSRRQCRPGLIFLFLAGLWASAAAQTLTVDEVIEKNIQASGGAERWAKITSMKMNGTYTNFSDPESFILWRQRPDLYRFECKRINMLTIHAFDGIKAWWVNPLMGPPHDQPQEIPSQGNLDKVTLRERFFDPVFWNYKSKGNQVQLVGLKDLDGVEVYQLKVTLKDKSIEDWFISTETFLPVSMSGDTYDFGMKAHLETFFSDFRDVNGLTLPFLIESEYGIRYRTYEITEILLNPEIKPDIFKMPGAGELKKQP